MTWKSAISEVLIYEVLTLGINRTSSINKKMEDIIKTNPTCDVDIPSPSDKREINVFWNMCYKIHLTYIL